MEQTRDDIRTVIAGNITALRKTAGYTQLKFAEKLNYSDKAVSKWERGESIPDIVVLKEIADLFEVSVDYLLKSEHPAEQERKPRRTKNRMLISVGSVASVWLLATLIFTILDYIPKEISGKWLSFVYAMPISALLIIIFNCIWGKKKLTWLTVSLLEWSVLISIYLTFMSFNPWLLFVLGVPMQIVTIIFCSIRAK